LFLSSPDQCRPNTQCFLNSSQVNQLREKGFVVVDSFVPPKLVADIEGVVEKSFAPTASASSSIVNFMEAFMEAFGPTVEPLIRWRDPFPRGRWRDDRISFMDPDKSPCHLACFKELLSRFEELSTVLKHIVKLGSHRVERQLAIFRPSKRDVDSRGYLRHLDAPPDDGTKANRRITCILYLNSGKKPALRPFCQKSG
jgi:hypothetical protein